MKTELQYLMDAMDEWNRTHKWDKALPLTALAIAEVLHMADIMRRKDKERIEAEGAPTA